MTASTLLRLRRLLAATVAELGLFNAFLYLISRLGARTAGKISLQSLRLYTQPVRRRPLLPEGRGNSIEVRHLTVDEALAAGVPIDPRFVAGRRRSAMICVAAFKQDAVVGFNWLNFADHDDELVRCRFISLPHGQCAWGLELNIVPDARGSLVYARIWDVTHKYLRDRGILYTTSYVSAFNRMAVNSEERLGGIQLGRAVFLTIGSWQVMAADLPPYFHVSSSPGSVPAITLRSTGGTGQ